MRRARMFAQLRGGKSLCMLVDQKLREGIAVPFFGRDAMTTPAPAALALKTGAHIVFASNRRLPGRASTSRCMPVLNFTPSGDEAEDTQRPDRRHHRPHRGHDPRRSRPMAVDSQSLADGRARPGRSTRRKAKSHERTRKRILDTLFFGRDPLKDFPHATLRHRPAGLAFGPSLSGARDRRRAAHHRGRGGRLERRLSRHHGQGAAAPASWTRW